MTGFWKTVKGYIWWTFPRGSFHYDVMVTLILLFIFVTPMFVNFKDKPAERKPHPTQVEVVPDGINGFIFEVQAAAVHGNSDDQIRQDLMRVIEPIAGESKISRYEPVQDLGGRTVGYRVWVRRQ
ncbi:MAG: hypothetical protein ROO76_20110 [Terriglobia bacterium]|nr:hypothetical protein [Terriglobia bacterium]